MSAAQLRWRVADADGGTVFDADTVHRDPAVLGGFYTPRTYAIRLAKENSDPEAPPLRAVKDAK